jgi:hypothetical protein
MKENSPAHVNKSTFVVVTGVLGTLFLGASGYLGWLLYQISRPGVTVNCPILVRGGSMTAFTSGGSAWVPSNNILLRNTYCTEILASDISYIEFKDAGDPNASANWPDTVTGPPAPFSSWQIEIYGHASNDYGSGMNRGPNSMRFEWPAKHCNSTDPKKTPVEVTFVGSTAYPLPRLPHHKNHTDNLRMFYLPASKPEDQEFCERMAEVVVIINGTQYLDGHCPDGDCSVGMGTPR